MSLLEVKPTKNTYVLTLDGKQLATVLYGLSKLTSPIVRSRLGLEDELWDSFVDLYSPLNKALQAQGIVPKGTTISSNLVNIARS